jgi:bisphosphoglycerate-independent phosphoglycerate mutase (AlkP superfamily)
MKAAEITAAGIEALKSGKYKMVRINYANPDMVGHTGEYKVVVMYMDMVGHTGEYEVVVMYMDMVGHRLVQGGSHVHGYGGTHW